MSESDSNNVARRLADIRTDDFRFIIMDAPNDSNIGLYMRELEKYNVTHIVRVCDPTYNKETFTTKGYVVHDWPFSDGNPPPDDIVKKWLELCDEHKKRINKNESLAVHCVAGLGRAPVLVAIALIESGMDPLDAVALVRKRRRGAINRKQLEYVEGYVQKKKSKKGKCIIS